MESSQQSPTTEAASRPVQKMNSLLGNTLNLNSLSESKSYFTDGAGLEMTPEKQTGGRASAGAEVGADHSTPIHSQLPQVGHDDRLMKLLNQASRQQPPAFLPPQHPPLPSPQMSPPMPPPGTPHVSPVTMGEPSFYGDVMRGVSAEQHEQSALSTGSSSLSLGHLQDLMTKMMLSSPAPMAFFPPPPPLPQQPPPPGTMHAMAPPGAQLYDPQQAMLAMAMAGGYNPFAMPYYPMAPYCAVPPPVAPMDPRLLRSSPVSYDPCCTWSGQLPMRNYKNQPFSPKIFVGGVPWDITEDALEAAFQPFGNVKIEWPGKEARYNKQFPKTSSQQGRGKVTGYVYVIYESDKSVRTLLDNCSQEFGADGDWYFKLTAKRTRTKEIRQVQIIPWVIADSNCLRQPQQRQDPKKTVFVGALHGMITAEILSNIMNDLFGNVVYAGIDTDKFKYPIGSGRVTFSTSRSYFKAIQSAFVEIKTAKFTKRVQIDPFLEDSACNACSAAPGPYFCREMTCFRYYCRQCWQSQHGQLDAMRNHKPLMRNTRRNNTPEAYEMLVGPSSPSAHYADDC